MQKSFQSLLWCISFVLVLFTSGFAQDSKLDNGNGRSQYTAIGEKNGSPVFNIDGTAALLWDNFLTQSTTAIVAGEWGGLPVGANQVLDAEDFVVPSAATWTVDQIAATGFYSVLVDAASWGVAFYADNAGVPGALIQAETVPVVAGDPNPAGFLSNPVVLTGGAAGTKYWISIYAIHPSAVDLASFRWNWYASEDPEILSEPYLRDDAGFFGGTAGWVTYTSLGLPTFNALMFQLYGTQTGGCPVGAASNPGPADGSTDVSINPGNATWTNGAGTTAVEVFFGPEGNMVSVYSGAAVETYAITGPLDYATTYEWSVVCRNDTCSASAETWSFTTEQDPNLVILFFDDFEAGAGNWTVTNDGGTCVFTVAPITQNGYTMPPTAGGNVLNADADFCGSGTTLLSTATVTNPIDASLYQVVTIEFDNDWQAINAADFSYVEVSVDGGTTWTAVRTFDITDVRNTHEFIDITSFVALQSFQLRVRSIQPGWDWWWALDNIKVIGSDVVPVELTSFAATTNNLNVTLNWSTATELNNSGFQVERSNGSAYEVVGFVAGHGTTTDVQRYSYVDQNVNAGSYTYRLKQVDFNGTFEYSDAIEVEVLGVKEFALGQNYPNPFNPSTKITFSLAVDSKVSLKIFDVLGQEVVTLLNGQLEAGSQEVSFNASSLNSGVYFYRIDASGVDGQKFSSTKKMILTK
jgi:hypothetical protein